jgi:hypothetical protein
VRSPNRTRRLKETFVGLPLAAQFVLALSALIAAGFAVAIGVISYGEYAETHSDAFMPLLIGAAVLISFVIAFFVWGNGNAVMRREHARFTREDAQSAVENCLDPHGIDHDEWDLFLGFPVDDPYLESIRQRCIRVWDEDGPEPVAPRLRRELEEILRELASPVPH